MRTPDEAPHIYDDYDVRVGPDKLDPEVEAEYARVLKERFGIEVEKPGTTGQHRPPGDRKGQ
jgi:hypothetical protein